MAIKRVIGSKYCNVCQNSVSSERSLAQDRIHDALSKRRADTAGAMKVADALARRTSPSRSRPEPVLTERQRARADCTLAVT